MARLAMPAMMAIHASIGELVVDKKKATSVMMLILV